MELSARVGERVDIYDIRLISQEAKLNDYTEKPTLIRCAHNSATKRKDDRTIHVEVVFTFEIVHNNDKSKQDAPVRINAVFALDYIVDGLGDFRDEEIQAFGKMNGVYNAWPFWRELVYSTMSRMGLPPYSLPVFRITDQENPE